MTPQHVDLEYFHLDHINKELYRSKLYNRRGSYTPRVIFINRVYRSTYWFPFKAGSPLEKGKLLRLKRKPFYISFSIPKAGFLDIFKLHLLALYNYNLNVYLESPDFLRTLSLLNEVVRKQEFKRLLPKIKRFSFNVWKKPPMVNRNIYLPYFYDFSVHRVISKFRKFNFLSINNWWINENWLFAIPKMRTSRLRRKKYRYEYFMFKFYRLPGMSQEYWAEQQLQYPYYSLNSFNLLSDAYNSSTFSQRQPALSFDEFKYFTPHTDQRFVHLALFCWLLENSANYTPYSLPAYSSYSYPLHHYTYGAKYKYLKNYFAYMTPRYAHAYFSRFRRFNFTNVVSSLRWYIFLIKPVYWNLRLGLDLHPHEFWEWMDVSWWEDSIGFKFSRFSKMTRRANFKKSVELQSWLGHYNLNIFWFYKSWIHESLFIELISSYYKRYYNFKYLTPGSRFQTEYPKKKWGHFDPKWQDRLFEYTYHRHPDQYFLPSTRRFTTRYSKSVSARRADSFIMLNFAWKINKILLFVPRKLPKKSLINSSYLKDYLREFKPSFNKAFTSLVDCTTLLPLIITNFPLIDKELELFRSNLIFLINFLSGAPINFSFTSAKVDFLILYLSHTGVTGITKSTFDNFKTNTYSGLLNFVCEQGGLSEFDIFVQKEQVIVEYLAFERWFTLLISEYNN